MREVKSLMAEKEAKSVFDCEGSASVPSGSSSRLTDKAASFAPVRENELGIDLAEDQKREENRKRRASLSFW
jgi:hypothetical protein